MSSASTSVRPASGEDVVVLLAGHDPIGEPLCTALSARGADVRQLNTAQAVEAIVAAVPDLVFLVGDAAKQRGALIRSQLVRRLRGTDITIAVLIEGQVAPSASAASRMLARGSGVEAIADRLIAWAASARAARTQGAPATLDQVADMVARALERPSQPPHESAEAASAHIVMQAAPTPTATATPPIVRARPTSRTVIGMSAVTPPALPARPLVPTPPMSIQALAEPSAVPSTASSPVAVSTASDVVALAEELEQERSTADFAIRIEREPPDGRSRTPVAWSLDPAPPAKPVSGLRISRRAGTVAAAAVLAVCGTLLAWHGVDADPRLAAGATVTKVSATQQHAPARIQAPAPPALAAPKPPVDHADAVDGTAAAIDTATASAPADDEQDNEPAGDEPELVRARALCGEGHKLRGRGRLGLAEAKYMEALRLFPRYPRAMAGVVRVHLTRGDGTEAVRWAERLVAMQPNRSNNQLLLGDAYALSGKTNNARLHWRQSAAFGNMAARKRLKADEAALAKPTKRNR